MTVSYTVAIVDAAAHMIDMRLEIDSPDPDGQVLTLPNWIPGSYMIRDFSRNIVSIEGSCGDQPTSIEKINKSSWRAPAGLACLSVKYRIYAWDLSVRAAHVDENHAFFNGTSVFLSVEGQESQQHMARFVRPEHREAEGFKLATGLRTLDVDDSGYGCYIASSYDELIDHPVEQGTFKKVEFSACGVPHEVVLTGACHFDEERVAADLKRICEYQIRFFGEPAPVDRYVFMVMVVDAGYGGLEHRNSTALMITRENLPIAGDEQISDKYLDFLGLCSHEYFHTWNVKRIKPASFVPYELHEESYTRLLWFFEGMTSYYDDLVLVRSGLIDIDRYLGMVSKTLTRVQRGSGRTLQSVTDSSFDAWHKFYKQDENAPNAIVSYYAKGALIALCLDSLIRQGENKNTTLDDLMRTVWNQWLENGEGLAEVEPQQLAASLYKQDFSEFFSDALYTTNELPLAERLAELGVELQWHARLSSADMGGMRAKKESMNSFNQELDSAEFEQNIEVMQPWLGANVGDAPGGVRIAQVIANGPAAKAGLSAGDLIIAIQGLSVAKAEVDGRLQRYADLPALTVSYFRLGELRQTSLPIEDTPRDTAVLSVVDEKKINAWLLDRRVANGVVDTHAEKFKNT